MDKRKVIGFLLLAGFTLILLSLLLPWETWQELGPEVWEDTATNHGYELGVARILALLSALPLLLHFSKKQFSPWTYAALFFVYGAASCFLLVGRVGVVRVPEVRVLSEVGILVAGAGVGLVEIGVLGGVVGRRGMGNISL